MSTKTLAGPLTAFHPPTSCFNEIWLNSLSGTVLGNPYDPNCKPSGWNTLVQYSPALCPLSYSSAKVTVVSAGTVTETVVDCCPSHFQADPGTYSCISRLENSASTAVFLTESSNQTTYTSTIVASGQGINAHSIRVRYQASDLAVLPPTSSDNTATTTEGSIISPGATAATSPIGGATPTSTSSSTPTSPPGSSGDLSTGAKAGIGIGTALGVISIVLVLIWLIRRKRKRDGASPQYSLQQEEDMGGYTDNAVKHNHELQQTYDNRTLHELSAPAAELPGSGRPHRTELPGA